MDKASLRFHDIDEPMKRATSGLSAKEKLFAAFGRYQVLVDAHYYDANAKARVSRSVRDT